VDQHLLLGLCAAGLVVCAGLLFMGDKTSSETRRVRELAGKKTIGKSFKDRLKVEDTGSRRKQIEETLGKIEERQNARKKKSKTVEARILFGLPRFILNAAINRRQRKFTAHFADAMDIIVRGVRTGLPLGDCLKIIAHESPDPLGAEFRRVVEGESLGIPIEVCLEQLYERMPISEVNFFSTVLNIQKTSGGNLGEALANLSNVLRGRKILREKIKALSAEAKVSAIIIGSLPIVVMLLVSIASPDYMTELYYTPTGQRNLMIGAGMMVMGTLMMRKMINFKF